MDPIIENYISRRENGLNYCKADGVAYQPDMSTSVPYDIEYFEKYVMYESATMGKNLNEKRLEFVERFAKKLKTIDVGVGCGTFVKYALGDDMDITGYDINPCAVHWLVKHGIYSDIYNSTEKFMAYTFWDSLEHIPDPQKILEKVPVGAYVFVSMPIYQSLDDIVDSKHYRPNEHYYYFTPLGLIKWFAKYKLKLRMLSDFEQEAGREGIKTFMFERVAEKIRTSEHDAMLRNYFDQELEETQKLAEAIGNVSKKD